MEIKHIYDEHHIRHINIEHFSNSKSILKAESTTITINEAVYFRIMWVLQNRSVVVIIHVKLQSIRVIIRLHPHNRKGYRPKRDVVASQKYSGF